MPTITSLERQKRRRRRISVFLDGAFAFGVNEEAVLRFALHKGTDLSDELRRDIEEYDLRIQSKLFAERHIAARMRSELEIRQYLRRKDIPDAIIEETIDDFRRVRLLDDEEFARAWVRDRMRLKPKSTQLLRRELLAKGIAADIVEAVLTESEQDDPALAVELARIWVRRHRNPDMESARRRLAGYLQRRGFPASAAFTAVREVLNADAHDEDAMD